MRRMRKRKKFRSRPIQIELSVLEIESLVRKRYLKVEEQADPAAISLAAMDFLIDQLAT
jgi:hypothetical protein